MKFYTFIVSTALALLAAGATAANEIPIFRGAVSAFDGSANEYSEEYAASYPTEVVLAKDTGPINHQAVDGGEDEDRTIEAVDVDGGEDEGKEIEPVEAVLWPFFVQAIGIVVFIISTRYVVILPYSAILFIMGLFMGLGHARLNNSNKLMDSINLWANIDNEVLFNVILPGLIFSDSYALDTHLFQVSFWQCIILAFPMVLGGTCITALVARFVLPYGWSWNLSMTVGSILSATDPVAVSALLSTVGAPPRLNALISGESLLNDGSAIVFYTIFNDLFLHEEAIGGRSYSFAQGLGMFCRMSLGATVIGLAFGSGLIGILYLLKRRLNDEENVLQVAATLTFAYLTYYTADVICGTSGVIATLTCGVMCKALGSTMINSQEIMANFWSVVEQLLNTLLFGLGGLVWGGIIANGASRVAFDARDWGYLFLFFILVIIIRFFLLASFYPLIKRIGLGANIPETIFLGYGGLRGAVGIALALALDKEIRDSGKNELLDTGTKLFGMIGGIAFLTLVVNGSTAGSLLNCLGLTKSSVVRQKVTAIYKSRFRETMLHDMLRLLAGPMCNAMDWALVKEHVPQINDMTLEDLKKAAFRVKEDTPIKKYKAPRLENILPYFVNNDFPEKTDFSWVEDLGEPCQLLVPATPQQMTDTASELEDLKANVGASDEAKELRLIFLELLRFAYDQLFVDGVLDPRNGGPGFVAYTLRQGLDFASDAVKNRNEPLNDYDYSHVVERPWEMNGKRFMHQIWHPFARCLKKKVADTPTKEQQNATLVVNLSMSFVHAHQVAQAFMADEFGKSNDDDQRSADSKASFADVYRLIVLESDTEIHKAEAALAARDAKDVDITKSHLFCKIMLSHAVHDITKVRDVGLVSNIEADGVLEEIGTAFYLLSSNKHEHPGELSKEEKEGALEKVQISA